MLVISSLVLFKLMRSMFVSLSVTLSIVSQMDCLSGSFALFGATVHDAWLFAEFIACFFHCMMHVVCAVTMRVTVGVAPAQASLVGVALAWAAWFCIR